MKKFAVLILLLMFTCVFTTACNQKSSSKQNMIQSKRRFADYLEQDKNDPTHVDLSEGPKLKYDAKLGPKNIEFDIKIVDPY